MFLFNAMLLKAPSILNFFLKNQNKTILIKKLKNKYKSYRKKCILCKTKNNKTKQTIQQHKQINQQY